MASRRPLIGVTASATHGRIMWWFNRFAVWRAGGRPVRITADDPLPAERVDGLLIGGGDDIAPTLYGGEVRPGIRIDPRRDSVELSMLEHVLPSQKPVLGICRGSQMLNVAMGGNLHADIYETYGDIPKLRTALPKKSVSIRPGTRLAEFLECQDCRVNALHHQSVNLLGDGLQIAAEDQHGIIQGIEIKDTSRFVFGVQWHPEFLVFDRGQQRLFRRLVAAC